MVSVLMNHLYAYCHLWQTLLPRTSYSFWSTGVACEVTRSQLLDNFFGGGGVAVHEGYGLLEEIAGKKSTLVAKHGVPRPHKGK